MKRITGLLCAVMTLMLCVTACADKKADDKVKTSTSLEGIGSMFPDLEGAVETEWEQLEMGIANDRTPGPTDYKYQGYITLSDDIALKYASSYEWKDVEPDVTLENIEKRQGNWKYSEEFFKAIVPEYYHGSVWLDGNTVLFSINTT